MCLLEVKPYNKPLNFYPYNIFLDRYKIFTFCILMYFIQLQ
jgi:hypothetical protein